MLSQPHHLRQRPHRCRCVQDLVHNGIQAGPLQLLHLGLAALVRPEDGGANDPLIFVQQHRRMGGSVEGKGLDLLRLCLGLPQDLRVGGFEGGTPVLRVLLAPAHMGIVGGIFTSGRGRNDPIPGQQGQLHAAAADIHTQNVICHIRTIHFKVPQRNLCSCSSGVSKNLTKRRHPFPQDYLTQSCSGSLLRLKPW